MAGSGSGWSPGLEGGIHPCGRVCGHDLHWFAFVVRTVQPILEDLASNWKRPAATWGQPLANLQPRDLAHPAGSLADRFAWPLRALGEYGSIIFIAGNMPMISEITPLLIITKLEQYDYAGATAIAVVMLVMSFVLLLAINGLQAWSRKRQGR